MSGLLLSRCLCLLLTCLSDLSTVPDFDGEADTNDVTEIGQAVRDIFRTLWNEVENLVGAKI